MADNGLTNDDMMGIIDALDMGVMVLAQDQTTQIINSTAYTMWKLDPEHFPVGSSFQMLLDVTREKGFYDFSDDQWARFVADRKREIDEGLPEGREFVAANGMTCVYNIHALDGDRRMMTFLDVTEQKKRETALEEAEQKAVLADKAKSEFLANMSHEIRTPMNGVLGMSELLARTELDTKQKSFTDIIVKSGNALLTIINDILDFSKIDAGQLTLDPAPFVLTEAIEDVATLVSTRAREKDLELIVRVEPGLPESFDGDVGRIRQVVTNLMGNAVKFTEVGHVLVDVRGEPVEGGEKVLLHFDITDTGIGIPDEMINAIFEKFSQVDASSTRRHEGTGLGLAITTRLIDLMEGKIGVTSSEGEGSTFWFEITLPVAGTRSNRRSTPVDVSGSRIIIVDDNQVNRSILSEQTASWKLDSCAASSGREGLAVIEEAKKLGVGVDCVILDYQMPDMNGEDVAKAIRSNPSIADTPIIILTSVDQTLSSKSLREMKIDAHLIKPARSSHLFDEIVSAIQSRREKAQGEQGTPALALVEDTCDADDGFIDTDLDDWESAFDGDDGSPDAVSQPTFDHASELGSEDFDAKVLGAERNTGDLDILVAEDNDVNQLVFTQILQDTDYRFEIFGNGKLAFENWKTRNPSMILMDVSMPEMNGLEAAAAIRSVETEQGLERTPIVGVTAHALKGDKDRCLEAGMDDYITKPVSPDMLEAKIREWIGGEAEADTAEAS